MYIKSSTLLAGAFAVCALAAPTPAPDCDKKPDAGGVAAGSLTAANIVAIDPKTESCAGATAECADAARASVAINKAFDTYKITTKGEQAALVAYMLFESVDFKFNTNQGGRAGQGTRMMAMPPFVEKYATAAVGQDAVTKAKAVGGDAGLKAVLALVNSDDEKSFGSAAWFLSTQCSQPIRAGLAAGDIAGWHAFLTECVGTTAAPERDPFWTQAKQVIMGSK